MPTKRVKAPASSPSLIRQLAFNEFPCSDKKSEGGLDFFDGDSILLGDIGGGLPVAVTPYRPIYVFNLDVKGVIWVGFSVIASRSIVAAPVGAVRAAGVTTITTTATHGYSVGDVVRVTAVANATFNGTFTIASIPTSTSFTYAQALADANSGNGLVSMPIPGVGTGILIPYGIGMMLASGENTWIASSGNNVFAYQAADHILANVE